MRSRIFETWMMKRRRELIVQEDSSEERFFQTRGKVMAQGLFEDKVSFVLILYNSIWDAGV